MNWFFNYSQFLSISFDFIHSTSRASISRALPSDEAAQFSDRFFVHEDDRIYSNGFALDDGATTEGRPWATAREKNTITMFFNHLTYTYTSKCCIRSPIWEIDFNFILIFFCCFSTWMHSSFHFIEESVRCEHCACTERCAVPCYEWVSARETIWTSIKRWKKKNVEFM